MSVARFSASQRVRATYENWHENRNIHPPRTLSSMQCYHFHVCPSGPVFVSKYWRVEAPYCNDSSPAYLVCYRRWCWERSVLYITWELARWNHYELSCENSEWGAIKTPMTIDYGWVCWGFCGRIAAVLPLNSQNIEYKKQIPLFFLCKCLPLP